MSIKQTASLQRLIHCKIHMRLMFMLTADYLLCLTMPFNRMLYFIFFRNLLTVLSNF